MLNYYFRKNINLLTFIKNEVKFKNFIIMLELMVYIKLIIMEQLIMEHNIINLHIKLVIMGILVNNKLVITENESRVSDYDFEKITAAADSYNNALSNWTETREKIALMLPADKQAAYRNVTEKMYTQLYKDLLALKKIDQ